MMRVASLFVSAAFLSGSGTASTHCMWNEHQGQTGCTTRIAALMSQDEADHALRYCLRNLWGFPPTEEEKIAACKDGVIPDEEKYGNFAGDKCRWVHDDVMPTDGGACMPEDHHSFAISEHGSEHFGCHYIGGKQGEEECRKNENCVWMEDKRDELVHLDDIVENPMLKKCTGKLQFEREFLCFGAMTQTACEAISSPSAAPSVSASLACAFLVALGSALL